MKKKYPVVVRGSGGGGGGGHTPSEASDTLRSRQIAVIVDALCEGPIEGLVGGAKGIYLDDSPLINFDGTQNYSTVAAQWRNGVQNQTPLDGFNDVEAETIVSTEVKFGVPVTRSLSDPTFSSIRVTVSTPALSEQKDNGDLVGSSVSLEIYIQKDNAGFPTTPSYTDTISGKTVANYRRSYIIALPTSTTGTWGVRVVRKTPDSSTIKIQNRLIFESFTGIIDTQLSYPNTALVGIKFDSTQFNAIPSRSFRIKGLIVRVPSNYTPASRDPITGVWTAAVYTGLWDGTFKVLWTNNPAWCFYDLITNERYGLGQFMDMSAVDKWSLYNIAQYCDDMVPTGLGSQYEPRFTCNLFLQTREEAYKVVQNFASIFRAITYWGASSIIAMQDSPRDPIAMFTNANVIDGDFNYTGSSIKQRHTAALVTWNDPDDMYRQKIEYVADDEGIRELGVIDTSVVAFGCSSRGQAHRMGKWMLTTERLATEGISFKTGMDAATLYPGAIILTSDINRAQVRMGGRVVAVSPTSITIDADFTIDDGQSYAIRVTGLEDATASNTENVSPKIHYLNIPAGAGVYREIPVGRDITGVIGKNAVFIIVASDVAPETWRVLNVKEAGDGILEVGAIAHIPGLYDLVERDVQFVAPPVSNVNTIPPAPTNFTAVNSNYLVDGDTVGLKVTLSWSGKGARYRVGWRRAGGIWQTRIVEEVTMDIGNVDYALYNFYVVAISAIGRESNAATLNQDLQSIAADLPVVTGLRLEAPFTASSAKYAWDATKGAISYEVKVKVGTPSHVARIVTVGDTLRFEYTAEDMRLDGGPWRNVILEVTALGKFGARSPSPAVLAAGNPQIGALNGIQVDPGFGTIFVKYTIPTTDDFAGVMAWVGLTADFLPSADSLVYDGPDMLIVLRAMKDGTPLVGGQQYFVRIAGYDDFGRDELTISNSFAVTPQTTALGPGSITAAMLKDGILTTAKFAQGIEPVVIVTTLPTVKSTNTVFNAADGKIYTWNVAQNKYTTQSFDLGDLTGTLKNAQIESIAASKVTGQMLDSQLAQLNAAKLLGQVLGSQIADGAIGTAKFAANLAPVTYVNTLPSSNIGADVIYNRADGLLYRWGGTSYVAINDLSAMVGALDGTKITSLPAAKVTGTLVSAQIASVEGQKITGLLTQAQIEAAKVTGQMVASQIQNGAIIHDKIAANAVYQENIAAGAVTARTLAVGDFTNLVNCGTGANITGFSSGLAPLNDASTKSFNTSWWGTIGEQSPYLLTWIGRNNTYGNPIPVRVGDEYYFSMLTVPNGGNTNNFEYGVGFILRDNNGAQSFPMGAVRATGQAGTIKSEGTLVIPAGVVTATIFLLLNASDATNWAEAGNGGFIGNIQVRRRNGGNLIVDGAITATKIAANSIDASKIQAGAITAGKIAAGSVTTAELSVGVNGNLLRYSTFLMSSRGWVTDTNSGLPQVLGKYTVSEYSFNNETLHMHFDSAPAAGASSDIYQVERIGVRGGAWYEYSMYVNTHRCTAILTIGWFDAAGTAISYTNSNNAAASVNTVANTLNNYVRLFGNSVAPSNAVSARFVLHIAHDGQNVPYVFFLRGYFAESTQYVTSPSPWTPMGVTQIDGQIITTRTIAAEQIMAETITANELSANSITTNKLIVTGKGKALNDDPSMKDSTAWTIDAGTGGYFRVIDSPMGSPYCFTAPGRQAFHSRKFPVMVGKRYKMSFVARTWQGIANCYARVHMYKHDGTLLTVMVQGVSPLTSMWEDITLIAGWTQYVGYIDAPTWATQGEINITLHTRYADAISDITDIRVEEYIGADLIVDGAISARHISAGSITADKIVGGTITGDKIAAGAITANSLAAGSVVAGKIAAGAISATEIAAGSIIASKLAIGDITNMCTNPNGDSGLDGWSRINSVVTNSTPGLPNGVKVLVNVSRDSFFGNAFDCSPGAQFAISVDVFNGNSNSEIAFGLVEYDAAMAVTAWNSTGATCTAANGLNSWKNIKGICTISNPATAKVRIYVQIRGFGADIGTWYMHNVNYRRAVNGELVVDGAITTYKIAAGSIIADRIAALTITGDKIAAGQITSEKIEAGAITTSKLAAGSITADKIVGGTLTGDKIAANTITADKLVANSITAGQLAAGSVTAGKIAAGAVSATEIAAGAITTDKLAVISRGSAINANPECSDVTAWASLTGVTIAGLGVNGASGTSAFVSNATANNCIVTSKTFPLSVGKTYRVSAWIRTANGNGTPTTAYLRCFRMNGAGADVAYDTQLEGFIVNEFFTNVTGTFVAEANTTQGLLRAYLNWGSPAAGAVTWLQDFRIEEVLPGTLIKDGAITAQKIQAATITGDKIAGNTITADKLVVNSITSDQIAASSIRGDRISGQSITGDKIAGNTITGDKIVAGSISADRIQAGTFQTATSGKRVVIDSVTNGLRAYDVNNNIVAEIGGPSAGQGLMSLKSSVSLAALVAINTYSGAGGPAIVGISEGSGINASGVFGNASGVGACAGLFGHQGSGGYGVYGSASSASTAGYFENPVYGAVVQLGTPLGRALKVNGLTELTHPPIITSDINTKYDIHTSILGLDFILALRTVSYRSKLEKKGPVHYGLIAQEVRIALKRDDIAIWDAGVGESPTQSLNYTEITAPLIRAVQEMHAMIEGLQMEVAYLRKQIEDKS